MLECCIFQFSAASGAFDKCMQLTTPQGTEKASTRRVLQNGRKNTPNDKWQKENGTKDPEKKLYNISKENTLFCQVWKRRVVALIENKLRNNKIIKIFNFSWQWKRQLHKGAKTWHVTGSKLGACTKQYSSRGLSRARAIQIHGDRSPNRIICAIHQNLHQHSQSKTSKFILKLSSQSHFPVPSSIKLSSCS